VSGARVEQTGGGDGNGLGAGDSGARATVVPVPAKHAEGCTCTRCRGFEPGNQVAARHGAYASELKLAPRAAEHVASIRALMPFYSEADELPIRGLAIVLVRVERAEAALEAAADDGHADLQWLRDDLRRWLGLKLRYEEALGMPAAARGRLGLDVARTRRLDLTKLTDRELDELEGLIERAEEVGDA
jgi:hypothetical protein